MRRRWWRSSRRRPRRRLPATRTPSSAAAAADAAATRARARGRCPLAGCAAIRYTARPERWSTVARACVAPRASSTTGPRTTTWTRTCRAPISPARARRTGAARDGLASASSACCCPASASTGPCAGASSFANWATRPARAQAAAASDNTPRRPPVPGRCFSRRNYYAVRPRGRGVVRVCVCCCCWLPSQLCERRRAPLEQA